MTNPGSRAGQQGPGASDSLFKQGQHFQKHNFDVISFFLLVHKFANTLDSMVVPVEVTRTIKSKLSSNNPFHHYPDHPIYEQKQ